MKGAKSSVIAGLVCLIVCFLMQRVLTARSQAPTASAVPDASSLVAADADFQARCQAPGVIKCRGWDSASEFVLAAGKEDYADGVYPAADDTIQGTMDTTVKTSGAGSLRFTIRPHTGANTAGYWLEAFGSEHNRVNFGAHSTFYVQWRQRFSPEMLLAALAGWKQVIMYSVPGPSCATTQLVMENTYGRNIASGYTQCGARGLYTNNGKPPMLMEQGDYNCPYGGKYAAPKCFVFPPDTWLTFYWKVQIGDWDQPNSYLQAWVGVPNQPLKRFIDLPNFVLKQDPAADFNEIQLTPYITDKDPRKDHPLAYTWYDELIISRQPIAAPGTDAQATAQQR
jgi:hypothetical protein